jgi:hypothetical protein
MWWQGFSLAQNPVTCVILGLSFFHPVLFLSSCPSLLIIPREPFAPCHPEGAPPLCHPEGAERLENLNEILRCAQNDRVVGARDDFWFACLIHWHFEPSDLFKISYYGACWVDGPLLFLDYLWLRPLCAAFYRAVLGFNPENELCFFACHVAQVDFIGT